MTSKFHLILTGTISAAVFFWLGHFSAEVQHEMPEFEFPEIPVPECPSCAPCVACPEPVECPPLALHHKVLNAQCDVRVADAYVRGTEDAHDATDICTHALKELKVCKVEECGDDLERLELDMMGLGLNTMLMNLEVSNWGTCCDELLSHWPTPGGDYGEYPEDFPSYCR